MANQQLDQRQRRTPLYVSLKRLHDQAKQMWKDAYFEIYVEPIDPNSPEEPQFHTIRVWNCFAEFEEDDSDLILTTDELFSEIERLTDYKTMMDTALETIDFLKEEYRNAYRVNLTRIVQYGDPQPFINYGAIIGEHEDEDEGDNEEEWEHAWETDSGQESAYEYDPEDDDNDSLWELDSGLRSASEEESDPEFDGEQDIDVAH